MKNPKSILITGASSGIGEGLALAYAARGVTLALTGRDRRRLTSVAKACSARGAKVLVRQLDVRNAKAVAAFIKAADRKAPLELVIANAGVGVQKEDFKTMLEAATFTNAVNVVGVFNTVHPAFDAMKKRGRGQVAIMASLAGLIGLPSSPVYSASKNAVRAYGEALRPLYAAQGIQVNVICPGWVRSRITDRNRYSMPFFMEVDKAVPIIVRGLARNKGRIMFPWPLAAMVRLMMLLPISWASAILGRVTMRGRA
ncbi:MAG TPA: SDR family NAD(P)-dependent oxidoreductase [Sphingomonadales bacterium]|nr:SDR family NAD(P)-dependent oxidoreductase [Sphingomonadales bacterium]